MVKSQYKIIRNKKGQIADFMIENISDILFIVVVLGAVLLILGFFTISEVQTQDSQSNIYFNMLIYSDAVWKGNGTNAQIGIVDRDKLSTDRLASKFNFGNERQAAMRVILHDKSGKEIQNAYYNQLWFERWFPIAATDGEGKSSVNKIEKTMTVSYIDGDVLNSGLMKVIILIPRS